MISAPALWAKVAPRSSVRENAAMLRATVEACRTPIESALSGPSMGSAIPDGARIRISPLDAASFMPGRVLVCATRGALIAHRVVDVGRGAGSGFVVTIGDGNWVCDAPTAKSGVIGEVREYCVDGNWRPVPPAAPGPVRRLSGTATRLLYAAALAISPHLAMLVGRAMNYARELPGVLLGRLRRDRHVRP